MSGRSLRDLQKKNYIEEVDSSLTPADILAQQFRDEDDDDQHPSFVPSDISLEEIDESSDEDIFQDKSQKKPRRRNRKQETTIVPSKAANSRFPAFLPPFKAGKQGPASSRKRSSSPMTRNVSPVASSRKRCSSPMTRNVSPAASYRQRSPSPTLGKPATNASSGLRPADTSPGSSDSDLPTPKSRSRSPRKPITPRRSPRLQPRLNWNPETREFSPGSRDRIGNQSSATPTATSSTKERRKSSKEQLDTQNWIKIVQGSVNRMKETRQPFDGIKMKHVLETLLETKMIEPVGWSPKAVKDKARRCKAKVSHIFYFYCQF